jgi:hypothetical protein
MVRPQHSMLLFVAFYVKRNWVRHAYVKRVVASVTESRSKMSGSENLIFVRSDQRSGSES